MEFYIAQGIGLIVTGLSLIGQHFKKMHWIVLTEVMMNVLCAVQYLLLPDGTSGMWVSIIASANAMSMLICGKFGNPDDRKLPNILCVVFAAAQLAVGIRNIHVWYDALPVMGAMIFAVTILQTKPFRYRVLRIVNGIVWSIYGLCVGAYTGILTQMLGVFSAVAAIWRLDIKKKEKDTIVI